MTFHFFPTFTDNVDDLSRALDSSAEPPVAINKISQVSEIGSAESEKQNIQLGVCQFLPPLEISELCEILCLPVWSFYCFQARIFMHVHMLIQSHAGSL